ncbi:MAG: (2Fe-2S) ferredoxin domain-containing protein [Candidatus Margulisiibacteriota bacterium]|nr:MAG: hypothetical protein A2X43_11760 [Candidatus Margulisbacteria bacterium GWD2_39_127]OGI01816.1 MAG: hypothetical protein A2X42_04285 [Candidatus Margulisbacteria bacterium GWF2_38_17]OGI10138.1 MAG: hypothetical protein A2X41_01005 [Candidatus Margulisbacteria bacterium GWE2_39_32]PZM79525.1 MAG: (2Fe-2S) ferredoxin domain-containing protein [Candidatus Margulisiibacteriota bacterium]HAR63802.1 ferredoxin [Candidatus Margulisiibacteriota bacterium]
MNPLEKLKQLQEDARQKVREEKYKCPIRIYVGSATCENAAGAREVYNELVKLKQEKNYEHIYIGQTGCSGRCDKEPIVQVMMESSIPIKYCEMNPQKIRKVFEQHIENKKIIREWAL